MLLPLQTALELSVSQLHRALGQEEGSGCTGVPFCLPDPP